MKKSREYRLISFVNKKILENYDKRIYSDSFILTNRQKIHIKKNHEKDYRRIMLGLKKTLDNPTEIIEDENIDGTLYFIRKLSTDNQNIVVKMNINDDTAHPHNSIITSFIVTNRAIRRIRNKGTSIYYKQ